MLQTEFGYKALSLYVSSAVLICVHFGLELDTPRPYVSELRADAYDIRGKPCTESTKPRVAVFSTIPNVMSAYVSRRQRDVGWIVDANGCAAKQWIVTQARRQTTGPWLSRVKTSNRLAVICSSEYSMLVST